MLADREAAHGLEQQLIHALVECLSHRSAIEAAPGTIEHRDVAVRVEALLQARQEPCLRIAEIRKLLGVSGETLRIACEEQLGMAPLAYIRCRSQHAKPQSVAGA